MKNLNMSERNKLWVVSRLIAKYFSLLFLTIFLASCTPVTSYTYTYPAYNPPSKKVYILKGFSNKFTTELTDIDDEILAVISHTSSSQEDFDIRFKIVNSGTDNVRLKDALGSSEGVISKATIAKIGERFGADYLISFRQTSDSERCGETSCAFTNVFLNLYDVETGVLEATGQGKDSSLSGAEYSDFLRTRENAVTESLGELVYQYSKKNLSGNERGSPTRKESKQTCLPIIGCH